MLLAVHGEGESESYTSVGYDEATDVDAAVRYAGRELGMIAPVLYGRSMGACAVWLANQRAWGDLALRPFAGFLLSTG